MIDILFSEKENITKNDVLVLMQSLELSSESKNKLKSIIGGEDKGFHQWHQIYDVLRFYKEYKFPNKYWNIALIRGQTDKQFEMIFKNLFGSWLDVLLQVNLKKFETDWQIELLKRKKVSDKNAQKHDPNL